MTVPPPPRDLPAGHLAARRAHLMTEITTPARRLTGRRIVLGGGLTASLAAGLAAALILTPTAEVGGKPPAASASAAEILNRAARTAAAQPDLKPGPGQFLYFESRSYQAGTGESGASAPDSQHRKVWLSVSGKRAGVVRSTGGVSPPMYTWLCDGSPDMESLEGNAKQQGEPPKVDLSNPPQGCENRPAYRPGLPADAGRMRKWLYANSQGGNPPDVQAFITVGDTIRETYIGSKAQAALFAAAAKIPGVTTSRGAVDLAGRKGIAVGQTWHGIRHELIFDPRTYKFLGERQVSDYDNSFRPSGGSTPDDKPWTPGPGYKLKQGAVLYASVELRMAVTDQAGRL